MNQSVSRENEKILPSELARLISNIFFCFQFSSPTILVPQINFSLITKLNFTSLENLDLNAVFDSAVLIAVAVQLIMMMLPVVMVTQVTISTHISIPLWTQVMMMVMMINRCTNGWTRRVDAVSRTASGLHVTIVLVMIKQHVPKAAPTSQARVVIVVVCAIIIIIVTVVVVVIIAYIACT